MFKSICFIVLSAFVVTVGILITFMFIGCEDLGTKGLDAGSLDAGKIDADVQPPALEQTAADLAIKAVQSTKGTYVKVVGGNYDKEATPIKLASADVVPIIATDQSTCNVVFDSKKVSGKPEALSDKWGKASTPVEIPGSCLNGSCIWNGLLTGDECKDIADLPGYLGSTYEELVALPTATQARFMKVAGTCMMKINGKDVQTDCTVPVGDPKAKLGAEPFFPHSWSKRDDLNQIKTVKAPVKTLEDLIP